MTRRTGFTLIELVVVIMILGILAGVAAPRLFQTSATAADNGAKQSLSIVRDAIELYAANNGGELPDPADSDAFKAMLTPYIRGQFPTCPVSPNMNANVTIVGTPAYDAGAVANGTGWKYSTFDGSFIINNETAAEVGGFYDQF